MLLEHPVSDQCRRQNPQKMKEFHPSGGQAANIGRLADRVLLPVGYRPSYTLSRRYRAARAPLPRTFSPGWPGFAPQVTPLNDNNISNNNNNDNNNNNNNNNNNSKFVEVASRLKIYQ